MSFQRAYELTFTTTTNAFSDEELIFSQSDLKPLGLMVDFNIMKSRSTGKNQGNIRITNPSRDTMAAFQKEGKVTLKAGYHGDIAKILVGRKESISFTDEGGSKTIDITVVEGAATKTEAIFSKNYSVGTRISTIIDDIVQHLIDKVDSIEEKNKYQITDFTTYTYPQVVYGDSFQLLEEILGSIGYEYFINRGTITILKETGFVRDLIVDVNPYSGMIGSPKPISEKKGSTLSNGIQFRHVLNYNFDIGRLIKVFSNDIEERNYVIDSVNFIGNTFQGDWICDVRAMESNE